MTYRLQIASDVLRDGLGVELIDERTREVVAEVFRRDSDNKLLFTAFTQDLPFIEIERLMAIARSELVMFEDGTALPDRVS